MNKNNKFFICAGIIFMAAIVPLMFKRRKYIKQLLIIGNGFDLYHGIPSSYLSFRDYVQQNDFSVYGALEKYLHLDGNNEWSEFENNLANLDADDLLDEMRIFLGDSEKASSYFDYQYEVERVTEKLGQEMQQLFLKWLLQLDIRHHSTLIKLLLPKNCFYLNFNYTSSLERLYEIQKKDILYIHGKAVDINSSIVLGHGWEKFADATKAGKLSYEDLADGGYGFEEDRQFVEAKESIQNYFERSYKNAKEIIKINEKFFKGLAGVKEIVVMGHSMRKVDLEYFKAIAGNINLKTVNWVISCHKLDDKVNCMKTLEEIGVDLKLVDFKKLVDIFSIQLKMF